MCRMYLYCHMRYLQLYDHMRGLHLDFRMDRPTQADRMSLHDGSFRIAAPDRYRSGHFRR